MRKKLMIVSMTVLLGMSSFAQAKGEAHFSVPSSKAISTQKAATHQVLQKDDCISGEAMGIDVEVPWGDIEHGEAPRTDCCKMEEITFSPSETGTGQSETFNRCVCPAGCTSGC